MGHVHEQERIEHHGVTARFQIADGARDGLVGGRSAIGAGPAIVRHHQRRRTVQRVHLPGARCRGLDRRLDFRPHRALAAAEIVAEPAHDQQDRPGVGQRRLEIVQRHAPVGAVFGGMPVLGYGGAAAEIAGFDDRVIGELARTGDQRHRLHGIFQSRPTRQRYPRNTSKDSCGMRLPKGVRSRLSKTT